MALRFKLKLHSEDPWGFSVNYSDDWKKGWVITSIIAGQQAERLGVLTGFQLESVDEQKINSDTAETIKAKLMKGDACTICFINPEKNLVQPTNENLNKRIAKTSAKGQPPKKQIKQEEKKFKIQMHWLDTDDLFRVDRYGQRGASETNWDGVRSNFGVRDKGKWYFEATVVLGLCRVGWATDQSSRNLGTDKFSYGYGGTGKCSFRGEFDDYGDPFDEGDTIGCFLDLDDFTVSWSKNGEYFDIAYDISRSLRRETFFPAVVIQFGEMKFNFGSTPFQNEPGYGYRGLEKANDFELIENETNKDKIYYQSRGNIGEINKTPEEIARRNRRMGRFGLKKAMNKIVREKSRRYMVGEKVMGSFRRSRWRKAYVKEVIEVPEKNTIKYKLEYAASGSEWIEDESKVRPVQDNEPDQYGLKLKATKADMNAQSIAGTSNALEKNYLRLTTAIDPSKVRDEETCTKVLANLLEKWKLAKTYADKHYIFDQFRSLRQDLKVQRIRNQLAINVYEANVKICLELDDFAEFNQCQQQLKELYMGQPKLQSNAPEFRAYRILYHLIMHDIFAIVQELMHKITITPTDTDVTKNITTVTDNITTTNTTNKTTNITTSGDGDGDGTVNDATDATDGAADTTVDGIIGANNSSNSTTNDGGCDGGGDVNDGDVDGDVDGANGVDTVDSGVAGKTNTNDGVDNSVDAAENNTTTNSSVADTNKEIQYKETELVKLAFKAVEAFRNDNSNLFFKVYTSFTKHGKIILDKLIWHVRFNVLCHIKKAYMFSLPLTILQSRLGFTSEVSCIEYLKKSGIILEEIDGNMKVSCKKSGPLKFIKPKKKVV